MAHGVSYHARRAADSENVACDVRERLRRFTVR
jgi:hypothetical protein